ncbi:MAG: YceI family protein [Rhodospirillaceae bacterium]|nr:YceI family protein [Rhodospirillaceae bacterium]
MKRTLLVGPIAAAWASFAPLAAEIAPVKVDAPAGVYKLDKTHASLIFRVSHMGFSNYTARFTRFDATLDLDPAKPAAARLTATVDAASLETDFPTPEIVDFNAELRGPQWLDAGKFPTMTYRSTAIEMTAPNAARIVGELTLRGVTKPVTLMAVFNGGYPGMAGLDPNARIGFSATGTLNRSDFGIAYGIPAPGSNMGVSDKVEIIIETEFNGPALPPAAPATKP